MLQKHDSLVLMDELILINCLLEIVQTVFTLGELSSTRIRAKVLQNWIESFVNTRWLIDATVLWRCLIIMQQNVIWLIILEPPWVCGQLKHYLRRLDVWRALKLLFILNVPCNWSLMGKTTVDKTWILKRRGLRHIWLHLLQLIFYFSIKRM